METRSRPPVLVSPEHKELEQDIQARKRILSAAREEFFRHGFSRVTLDEIAAKNRMSKKTIYKFFSGKEELVEAVARETLSEMVQCCRAVSGEEGIDFVEKLKKMMTLVALQYANLGKTLVEDIERHAPELWKEIAEFRTQHIKTQFGALLREGGEKGIFRGDVDLDLVLMIYSNAIQTIITPDMLIHLPYSAAQIFETIVKVIFEGILSEEAKPKYLSHTPILTLAQQRV